MIWGSQVNNLGTESGDILVYRDKASSYRGLQFDENIIQVIVISLIEGVYVLVRRNESTDSVLRRLPRSKR